MPAIHVTTFPIEAIDQVKEAAEAACEVEGIHGYRLFTHTKSRKSYHDPVVPVAILHLEIESKDAFAGIAEHDRARSTSEALWKEYPPEDHQILEFHCGS